MAKHLSSFTEVVALWDSYDALAADISTTRERVRKWSERKSIPAEWWAPILATSVAKKARLKADALVALAAAREPESVR